jgi:hypothetical protein
MNDEDLERRISLALHKYFPEPEASHPRWPNGAGRRGARVAAVGGSVGVVLAAGLTVGLVEATSSTNEAPPIAASGASTTASVVLSSTPTNPISPPNSNPSLSTTASAPPEWAKRCLPKKQADDLGPAPEYVGLTRRQAERLATQEEDQLLFVGGGGKCTDSNDLVGRIRPVAVVYDVGLRRPYDGRTPLPWSARVILAERVDPRWEPGS